METDPPESGRTAVMFSLRDDPGLVRTAESLGFESAWAAEGQGRSAFGKLERWATVTEEIGLATGIVNVFSRTPAALAQAAATLDAHSGGRAILGLGVAHPGVVEEFVGMDYDRPLARMAEYVGLVRAYLRGETDAFEGEFFSPTRPRFWAAFEPERSSIPIYNGALGPDNVRLTGALADGWLPNLYPDSRIPEAREWLAEGAESAGRSPDDVDVAMLVLTAVHEDERRAHRAVADHVAYYLREIPGYYDRVAVEAGFEDDVEAVRNAEATDAAAATVSDALVDRLAVVGTPETARDRLGELRDLGVDLPIVRAPAGTDRRWVERTLSTFAPNGERE
jgi:alkanesulfonate monooxygenase SsuD/methylene tetrahydromethanopterin reductase-like flavin-dependent oxidoreductase (luciferase family)